MCLTSNVRLYQNNDVLDGFICLRHEGRQHNIRVSRRLRPEMDHLGVGPLRMDLARADADVRLVLEPNDHGIALDLTCRSTTLPYMDPVEITRVDGRLLSERATYEMTGTLRGLGRAWTASASSSTASTAAFFRNHSWGYQAGRGGPRLYGAPLARRGGSRASGSGCCSTCPTTAASTSRTRSAARPRATGWSCYADRAVPVQRVGHELTFYEGGRRLRAGTFELADAEGAVRTYEIEDMGWVYCQGGGYFGGFDDGLGQGVYRGDYHEEGEVWDVLAPDADRAVRRTAFEFDHDWAESFTRLRSGDQTGLAHFECVVIRPPAAS